MEDQTIETQLKDLILSRYGDVKSFSIKANIPNSTLNTIFKRGILNANICNIAALTAALDISIDGLVAGEIVPRHSDSDNFR